MDWEIRTPRELYTLISGNEFFRIECVFFTTAGELVHDMPCPPISPTINSAGSSPLVLPARLRPALLSYPHWVCSIKSEQEPGGGRPCLL